MTTIHYSYQTSGYDFLKLFDHNTIESSTVVLVSSNEQTQLFDNNGYVSRLLKTNYNYAVMSDTQTAQKWFLIPGTQIPKLDTKVFVINDVLSAQHVFQLAKLCRDNIEFYRKLYRYNFDSYDNNTLSIANHIYNSPSGFFDFPCGLAKRLKSPDATMSDYGYNSTTKALINYSKVTSIV